jgi:hypothetical protein
MSSKVINLTTDASKKSGKRAKSASPAKSNSASTSIIDNILKERAASTGSISPGKKLIIDLAKDNFILTDAKPSPSSNLNKPQPIKPLVSKPMDQVVFDIPAHDSNSNKPRTKSRSPSTVKDDFGDEPMNIDDINDVSAELNLAAGKPSGRKSSGSSLAGSLGNSVISREKMDKMKALDAVFLRSTPSPIPERIDGSGYPIPERSAGSGYPIPERIDGSGYPIPERIDGSGIGLSGNMGLGLSNQKQRPKSADPLDFIFNDTSTNTNTNSFFGKPASPQPTNNTNIISTSTGNNIKTIKPLGMIPSTTATTTPTGQQPIDTDLNRQKLESVNRNILKIQQKIHEKGAKEKYAVMLKDLEKQKQKYESRLATAVTSKSTSSQPVFSPPSYHESMLGLPPNVTNTKPCLPISVTSPSNSHRASPRASPDGNLYHEKTKSPSPIPPKIQLGTHKQSADQEERLATDRELARIRELFPDTTGNKSGSSATRPKEVQSLFNVSNNLETLRDKQRHLEQQHKKLEEQYAHKLKQIERMRTQKTEITKLSALEQERRKIYEMEQKLKRLDKEQWEEQQRLRKELQTINMVNLQAISRNNNQDVGEFYALKQALIANGRATSISPVPPTGRLTLEKEQFRLVDWFAGFMGNAGSGGRTNNKKYQPEEFKEVALGTIGTQLIGSNKKAATGYHYYNTELPSTAWDLEPETGTESGIESCSKSCYLGSGNMCDLFKAMIITDLCPETWSIDDGDKITSRIAELSTSLGCDNHVLVAKGLDFIVDKVKLHFSSSNISDSTGLLNRLTQLLTLITSRMVIIIE